MSVPPSTHTAPSQQGRSLLFSGDSWQAQAVLALTILAIISFIVFALYNSLASYPPALIILYISYFPMSYLSYRQFRGRIHRERVKDDFRLLGLTDDEGRLIGRTGEAADLDAQYDQIYSPQQFLIYASLATATVLLGFGFYRFRGNLGAYLDPDVAMTVFHSFLGAYVFSLYYIFRRYITLDLQPGVYLDLTQRMIGVQMLAFVLARVMVEQIGSSATTGVSTALIPAAAFVIGYLPGAGINWLLAIAKRVIGQFSSSQEGELFRINGISTWHEARLRESGIDNVQNMASVDVPELLLSSRFSAQQLMHWIDQAILMILLPKDKYEKLCQHGIRTISALRLLLDKVEPNKLPLQKEELSDLWAVYYSAQTGPNLHYVTAYWQAVEQFRTTTVQNAVLNLIRDRTANAISVRLTNILETQRFAELVDALNIDHAMLEALFPSSSRTLVGLGRLYIQTDDYDEAVRVLDRALTADPDNVAAHSLRGLAYARLGDFNRAFAEFARSRQLDDRYPENYQNQAIACILNGDYEGAVAACDRAIDLDRRYSLAYYQRGRARRFQRQYDRAIDDLNTALRYQPDNCLPYHERGLIHLEQADFPNAIRDFDEAIRGNRNDADLFHYRGAAYAAMEDYRRAMYDLDTALELSPRLAEVYVTRGLCHYKLGNTRAAIDDCNEAIRLDDKLAKAYLNRGLAYAERRSIGDAIADFRIYLSLQPQAPDYAEVERQVAQLQRTLDTQRVPGS